MLQWIAYWGWSLTWRLVVTAMCAYTFQNIIHQEGYTIPWSIMSIAVTCAVMLIITWASLPKSNWNVDS